MGKAGDQLSIRGGVDLVAGDEVVTVKSITKVDGPQRVYNLEVASLDGQITHNYFVGEDEIWTHNAKRPRLDETGKLHGDIPNFPDPSLTDDQLGELAEDLSCSINTRQRVNNERGPDRPHGNRLRQEFRFLRQVVKRLSRS